jgi:hypothetical protein
VEISARLSIPSLTAAATCRPFSALACWLSIGTGLKKISQSRLPEAHDNFSAKFLQTHRSHLITRLFKNVLIVLYRRSNEMFSAFFVQIIFPSMFCWEPLTNW